MLSDGRIVISHDGPGALLQSHLPDSKGACFSPGDDAFKTAFAAFSQQLLAILEGLRVAHKWMVMSPQERLEVLHHEG